MCGRYYVDDETAKEIERIIRIADEKVKRMSVTDITLQAKDIHPTDKAPILMQAGDGLCCRLQTWGFPGLDGKQIIFNARSESALEKKMFKEGVESRRIVIPATWFYEWNSKKEKNTFFRKDRKVLLMAGIYSRVQGQERFVILTTAANESMQPVHDRMPLLLEENEVEEWILGEDMYKNILMKTPYLLERKSDYEQLSLF